MFNLNKKIPSIEELRLLNNYIEAVKILGDKYEEIRSKYKDREINSNVLKEFIDDINNEIKKEIGG